MIMASKRDISFFPSLVHQNCKKNDMNNVKILINQLRNKSSISLKWFRTKIGFYGTRIYAGILIK